MGLSSTKNTTKTTPLYKSQIEGAASTANATYVAQLPKLTGVTDSLSSLVPSLLEQYNRGDPNVNAAKSYNLATLNGDYLNAGNPHLQSMIDTTNDSVRNQVTASLGTRGLTGGSAHSDLVARALAQNETGLRYNDFSAERARMENAAGMAPTLSAASYQPLQTISNIAEAQTLPMQAASNLSATIGGLLGQYGTSVTKSNPSLGAILAQLGGQAASGWASGGFKGI
jgi:hypothetical protein